MSTPLLTYTPPLQRDLRAPWDQPINRNIIMGCGEVLDLSIELHRCRFPEAFDRLEPVIIVSTATEKDYEDCTHESYETSIWFKPNRESFRAAYRLARVIKCSAGDFGWVMRRDLNLLLQIDVAPNHHVAVLDGWLIQQPERLFA